MYTSKYFGYNLIIVLMLSVSFMLLSCTGDGGTPQSTNAPVFSTLSTPTIIAISTEHKVFYDPDLVIDLENAQRRSVEVQNGEIFQVKRPSLASEWHIVFSPDLVELLTSPEKRRSPGRDGWFFRALSQGKSHLVFTSIVSCDSPVPCPMMPARLELAIDIR